jgi:hypothetical protein
MTPRPKRFVIFGRYPLPGLSKTRLIPALGRYGAADLQRRITETTVKKVRTLGKRERLDIQFCFEGANEFKLRRWLGNEISYSRQEDSDLGTRMQAPFESSFAAGYHQVLLLGTDVPDFGEDHLRQALGALEHYDIVLGPSTDGGYWLIGCKRPIDLFHGIAWDQKTVREQTLSIARSLDLTVFELAPLSDIDTISDLIEWDKDEAECRPYISVIIPTLNEEKHIEKAIGNALSDEVEIVVVDGGSSDNTVYLAEKAGVAVVRARKGRASQQNRGATMSSGRVLLFLHADTILPEGYVDHVYEALMDPFLWLGAFRFKTDLRSPAMQLIEWAANFRSSHLNLPFGDQAFFMQKRIFEEMGGFSDVSIAEDLYLARQIAKKGRVVTLQVPVITSARKWRSMGTLRFSMMNLIITAGCCLGVSPNRLARLHDYFLREA